MDNVNVVGAHVRLAPGLYEITQELRPGIRLEYHNDRRGVKNWGEYNRKSNTIRLSRATMAADAEIQKFVILHELTHVLVTMQHDQKFYKALTELIERYNVSWLVAAQTEEVIPKVWYDNMTEKEKRIWDRME